MSTFTPNFQIEVPSPATLARDLGAELLRFGMSVDATLALFTYEGADPNLVLARVAALEAWRATTTTRLANIEAQMLASLPASGSITDRSVPAQGGMDVNISFPVGKFNAPPACVATIRGQARDVNVNVRNITKDGAIIVLGSNSSVARTVGAEWLAVAR